MGNRNGGVRYVLRKKSSSCPSPDSVGDGPNTAPGFAGGGGPTVFGGGAVGGLLGRPRGGPVCRALGRGDGAAPWGCGRGERIAVGPSADVEVEGDDGCAGGAGDGACEVDVEVEVSL